MLKWRWNDWGRSGKREIVKVTEAEVTYVAVDETGSPTPHSKE